MKAHLQFDISIYEDNLSIYLDKTSPLLEIDKATEDEITSRKFEAIKVLDRNFHLIKPIIRKYIILALDKYDDKALFESKKVRIKIRR